MNWAHKNLTVLNLSKTEAAVLTSLSLPKTVQDISRDSKVSRTGVNHVLAGLKKRGFVTIHKKGKRHLYAAVSTGDLSKIIQKSLNEIELGNTDTQGVRVKTRKQGEFVIHVGAREVITAYKRIAHENKNERIRAIQHHRSWLELIDTITPKQLVGFNQAIVKNHLIIDGMLNVSAYNAYKKEMANNPEKHEEVVKSLEGRMADYTVFPDDWFDYDTEMWLFKDTSLLIGWKEKFAIEITNANVTGFLRDMFESVKRANQKLNHQQALKEIIEKTPTPGKQGGLK